MYFLKLDHIRPSFRSLISRVFLLSSLTIPPQRQHDGKLGQAGSNHAVVAALIDLLLGANSSPLGAANSPGRTRKRQRLTALSHLQIVFFKIGLSGWDAKDADRVSEGALPMAEILMSSRTS